MSLSTTSTHLFNTSRDCDSTTSLGSLFQCLTTFSVKKFPNIQSKSPLPQLEALSSHLITCRLGEETDTHLTTTFLQAAVEGDTVPFAGKQVPST